MIKYDKLMITLDIPVSPFLIFGIISTWTGACGLISLNA